MTDIFKIKFIVAASAITLYKLQVYIMIRYLHTLLHTFLKENVTYAERYFHVLEFLCIRASLI